MPLTNIQKEQIRLIFNKYMTPAIEQDELTAEELKRMEYEFLKRNTSLREIPFKSSTDIGEGFDNLDNPQNLDMNSRLSGVEISATLIIDQLKVMGVFPQQATITHQFKQLKVSEGGKGRGEKVAIVTGAKETARPVSVDLFKKRVRPEDEQQNRPQG
jgi:hypothetical protein